MSVLLMAAGTAGFLAGSSQWALKSPEGQDLQPQIRLVPPPATALALAFGDRYLAGDLAGARAMIAASTLESASDEAPFARLLDLSSQLNPAHEDTYYLAEAYLPWQGRIPLAQKLLKRASEARPWDWLPPFFRAFNLYYFRQKPVAGAEVLRRAADHQPPKKGAQLRAIAGRWSALGPDPEQALRLVESMAQGASLPVLKRNLANRADQLRCLIRLRKAAEAFRAQEGRPPPDLESLVGYAGLEAIPADPMKDGFVIDESGQVRVKPPNLDRIRTPGEQ